MFSSYSSLLWYSILIKFSGFPRIDKLEIEGRGFHTNLYAVRGLYRGERKEKAKSSGLGQWLEVLISLLFLVSPDQIFQIYPKQKGSIHWTITMFSFAGETGRMYEANVDDVGYRLVAIYTPVREDGTEGQPISVSTDPIAVGRFQISFS